MLFLARRASASPESAAEEPRDEDPAPDKENHDEPSVKKVFRGGTDFFLISNILTAILPPGSLHPQILIDSVLI